MALGIAEPAPLVTVTVVLVAAARIPPALILVVLPAREPATPLNVIPPSPALPRGFGMATRIAEPATSFVSASLFITSGQGSASAFIVVAGGGTCAKPLVLVLTRIEPRPVIVVAA